MPNFTYQNKVKEISAAQDHNLSYKHFPLCIFNEFIVQYYLIKTDDSLV